MYMNITYYYYYYYYYSSNLPELQKTNRRTSC